jgi:hypothetical protein
MRRLFGAAIVAAICCSAMPAAAQKPNACMYCTVMCEKCGMGNQCKSTCMSNGNPMVTGACKNWFDACKKK